MAESAARRGAAGVAFRGLTPQARQALSLAERYAAQRREPLVQSEHLLWGLLQVSESEAVAMLRAQRADLRELRARLEALAPRPEGAVLPEARGIGREAQLVLTDAYAEAQAAGLDELDTRMLLLGLLRRPELAAGALLAEQHVSLAAARAQQPDGWLIPALREPAPAAAAVPAAVPAAGPSAEPAVSPGVSPVFIAILAVTIVAGYLAYTGAWQPRLSVFLFVTGGWMVSLCLHEFGHAAVAYLGGDRSVVARGYLTLNPLRYTHGLYSLLLPLLFMALGGIGLPGGAVYIRIDHVRTRLLRSLVSAAGPLANVLVALGLALPFRLGLLDDSVSVSFAAGLALLLFLQITAVLFNLLPIPGLDGFGILMPFLPRGVLAAADAVRPYGFFLIMMLFFVVPSFWQLITQLVTAAGISPELVWYGFDLYQLWSIGR
jgi:Zn-dependent protease